MKNSFGPSSPIIFSILPFILLFSSVVGNYGVDYFPKYGEDEVLNEAGENPLLEQVDPLLMSYLEGLQALTDEDLHQIDEYDVEPRDDLQDMQPDKRQDMWKFRGGKRADLWKFRGGKRQPLWKFRGGKRASLWKFRGGKRGNLWKFRGGKRNDYGKREALWKLRGGKRDGSAVWKLRSG